MLEIAWNFFICFNCFFISLRGCAGLVIVEMQLLRFLTTKTGELAPGAFELASRKSLGASINGAKWCLPPLLYLSVWCIVDGLADR